LQIELGRFAEARQYLERFAELAPLLEKGFAKWLTARRSDAAYYDGDFGQAVTWAKQMGEPFYDDLAKHLAERPGDGKRTLLPVGFVRQHYLTCAPATLAAIASYWQMPSDHLEVAAEICYDGTPDHSERHWAELHGWLAREFSVTWESAIALLDRGIPFTFTT